MVSSMCSPLEKRGVVLKHRSDLLQLNKHPCSDASTPATAIVPRAEGIRAQSPEGSDYALMIFVFDKYAVNANNYGSFV